MQLHTIKNGLGGDDVRVTKAKKLIERWEAIQEDRRSYEHENWHAVNVKRYHDGRDREELQKLAQEVAPDDQVAQFVAVEDILSRIDGTSCDLYDLWLCDQWDQLNYEVSDIVELGMRAKPFDRIRSSYNWAKNKSILSLGRSGGWACFQTTNEDLHEEVEEAITEFEEAGSGSEAGDLARALDDKCAELADQIEQVEELKAFIKKYNDGLNFSDEIKFRMEEKVDELDGLHSDLKIYDNGGKTVDRYTAIFKGDAYGMSEDPTGPAGFSQYIGDAGKLDIESLGALIAWEALPELVKRGIARRLAE